MRQIAFALAVAAAVTAFAAGKNTFSVGDGKTPDFEKYKRLKIGLKYHGREVKSDYITIPGYVIHWFADGTVETNKLKHVDSVVQTNASEQVMIRLDATNSLLVAANAQLEAEVTKWMAKSESFSNLVVVTQGRLEAANAKIGAELEALKEEKTDLEAKIADSKYILLRPWLKTKLAAVEARIKVLETLAAL